ncbi:MAG: hypothetical protein LPK26_14355 [Bacillaceae bacterium]|nr:hypothetical protein [Bacillaceae bacterium]
MKKVIIFILLGFVAGYYFTSLFDRGFKIEIRNDTNAEISGMYLTYYTSIPNVDIPAIGANKKYKLKVNPTEDFSETSMELQYKDKQGRLHQETVFGYIEQGYSGEAIVTIQLIDEEGKLQIEVEEKISFY